MFNNNRLERGSPIFEASVSWIKNFPANLKQEQKIELKSLICQSFELTEGELDQLIYGAKAPSKSNGNSNIDQTALALERELDALVPKRGFLRRYIDYTSRSEAPLAYHVFCALSGIGAILNRRVYLDMGIYKLFPTLGVIILGPSGIKKTSASNIIVDILQAVGTVKVYSEKLTPEALIDAMKGDNAVGLIYAPEMTVFLNKQKYNEGLVQLITRFMDCPDTWESGTIGRGKNVVRNIAVSSLMCSTLDWFIRSTPEDSFGGGFIARNLLIVQESSPRCEPIPMPPDPTERERLILELAYLHEYEGVASLDRYALRMYEDWYRGDHQYAIRHPEHELLASYYNRKPDHVKRLAICIHLPTCDNLLVCHDCFETALRITEWTEQFLPAMLQQMFKSPVGQEQEGVLRIIRASGRISHSDLVRKMSYRMNAQATKGVVSSLKEMRLVSETIDNFGHYYEVMED